jgi:energy-coupling factor transporter ATP-binding protein EcfA2
VLSSLTCRNFRSLESIQMPLAPLTALVGPNGAGKSAALRALDLIAGPVWPTLQRLRFPHDFTGYDETLELIIEVGLATPTVTEKDKLGVQHQIHGLRLRCAPYKRRTRSAAVGDPNFDYLPLDALGETPLNCIAVGNPGQYSPHRVTTPMREHGGCVLIDHRRAVAQHLPGTRGSVLGRLLAPALRDLDAPGDGEDTRSRREKFRERHEHAAEILRTPYVKGIEAAIDETTRRTLGFAGSAVQGRGGRVSFQIADPVNPYAALRIVYTEDGLEYPAEDVGLGVQSAIVVGIFEALRRTRTRAGTVLIDEPEMFLHPQAQRHFHRVLVDLVEQGGTQVIYSTHSPVFADATRFASLRLLRRPPGSMTVVTRVEDAEQAGLARAQEAIRLLTEYDPARSEALFADAVLLVEGPGDVIAARTTAARMAEVDLDAMNLTVMECGGKSGMPFHARLCRSLGIPVCALYDDDRRAIPDDADEEAARRIRANNASAERETAAIEAVLPDPEDRFVVAPSLEAALEIGRNAPNKPMRVAEAIGKARTRDDLPDGLAAAVERLRALAAAVTPSSTGAA